MYTLLLVDDEEDVIEVIERKVSWEQIGFHVVGHAGNGFKALEMMEDMQPDVVMTDIRMPYMDGLELCSNIRQRFPATKLLLFTGFDDFEYAKEAVHLEIEEYILKPLNLAEITEVFKKLKTKLDDELNEKKNTDILKQYYAASLPVLQSNFYTTLIEGRIPENELGRYMRDYKIVLEGPYYCCIIIHTSASQMPQGMDIRLLAVSVERQAQADLKELQSELEDGVVYAKKDGTVTTVCDPANPPKDGTPFLQLSGASGLYISGTIGELDLDKVKVGQSVSAVNYMTGDTYKGTISEISNAPSDSVNYGDSNPNSSFYGYTAYIENPQNLKKGDSLQLTIDTSSEGSGSGLYIDKSFVRTEHGQSYIYKDDNGKLKKQSVKTGRTLWDSYVEIKSGLTNDDYIAFPYGVREGEKTKVSEDGMY